MSDDYPPQRDQPTEAHDFDETVRRPPAARDPQPGPMARRVVPPTQATSRPMFGGEEEPPEKSGLYVPWWGFALVILAVAGITCGLWGVVLMNRGDAAASGGASPTPIFVVITASPTAGVPATVTPGTIVTTPPSSGATATPTIPPSSGTAITVGSRIVVRGTEGSGLTVRQGPGTDYTFVFVANEGEQFDVKDGPREATGFTWWYILDPNNPDRFGWAVSQYMQVVP